MLRKVMGIIVSVTAYGETSLILNVFTKDLGVIGVMAKGAKNIKSKLRSYVMPFTFGYFYIYYKENKLSTLKEVDIIDQFKNIHEDITLISYLNYIVSLSYECYKESKVNNIFNIMIEGLKKIDDKLDPMVISNIIEVKYLDYLGVGINLDSCSICGNNKDIITISLDDGGLICKNCLNDQTIYNIKMVKLLRMYYYVDIKNIGKLDIKDDIKNNINMFLSMYYDKYTGIYLKSKNFLNKVIDF